MNTALLALCRHHRNGVRYWPVPGFSNEAKLIPSRLTGPGWGPAAYWPAIDAKGEHIRGVDLDRHLKLAKQEIRSLIESCTTPECVLNAMDSDDSNLPDAVAAAWDA